MRSPCDELKSLLNSLLNSLRTRLNDFAGSPTADDEVDDDESENFEGARSLAGLLGAAGCGCAETAVGGGGDVTTAGICGDAIGACGAASTEDTEDIDDTEETEGTGLCFFVSRCAFEWRSDLRSEWRSEWRSE